LLEKWNGGVDWIGLAQVRDRWRAVVHTVMNLRGAIKCGEYKKSVTEDVVIRPV
jgi:hypothetical protein